MTRVLRKLCEVEDFLSFIKKSILTENSDGSENILCSGFRVLPPHTFYPVYWWEWQNYFDTQESDKFLSFSPGSALFNSSALQKSVAVHVWNRVSSNVTARKSLRGRQLYTQLVYSQCPITYKLAPEIF